MRPRKSKEKRPWDDFCIFCLEPVITRPHALECLENHRKRREQERRQWIIDKLDGLYEERTYARN